MHKIKCPLIVWIFPIVQEFSEVVKSTNVTYIRKVSSMRKIQTTLPTNTIEKLVHSERQNRSRISKWENESVSSWTT